MLMLHLFGHSCLIIMFYLNLHLLFRVVFIFMVCLVSSSVSIIAFSMGYVLH